jgi:hypothetical protein
MAVEYVIRCDGCGRLIASGRVSARAARAQAQLERGANSAGGEDWCSRCRKRRLAKLDEQAKAKAAAAAHSIQGPWSPPPR